MNAELPPIARAANRVLLDTEKAVIRFARRHKYQVGADLRSQAMEIARCAYRAWRERGRQLQRVHELAEAIDNLKLTMRLAKQLNAFGSFGEFVALAREVIELGRQCGGWLKSLHAKGRNESERAPDQRALTLSSRGASNEATL